MNVRAYWWHLQWPLVAWGRGNEDGQAVWWIFLGPVTVVFTKAGRR